MQANRIAEDSVHLSQLTAHAGFHDIARTYDKHMGSINKSFLSYAKFHKSDADGIFSFDKFLHISLTRKNFFRFKVYF